MVEHVTTIRDGRLVFIYSDDAAGLLDEGESQITRASHVEPATSIGWDGGGWIADMRPSRGPILFDGTDARGVKRAFTTRAAALAAEVAWLREHRGL